MNGTLCKFAILRYIPDEIRKEFINIGLVFHSPNDKFIDLKLTSNFSRVSAFDDEVDIDFLKIVLEGVKREFSIDITPERPSYKQLSNKNFLEKATSIYANQLQFSSVYTINSYDVKRDFNDLFKTYVYFDVQKPQRITGEKVKGIMNRVLKEKEVFSMLDRDIKIDIGHEQVEFDYAYETKNINKIVKTFSFDYSERGSTNATQMAKEWAWNYSKLRNNKFYKNAEIVSFIYVNKENENVKIALDILTEESSKIFKANTSEAIELFANKITEEILF